MNILITGIDGFVGKHLISMLPIYFKEKPIFIYGTCYKNSSQNQGIDSNNLFCLDITDKAKVFEVINSVAPDYIFHFAAQSSVGLSWKNPQLTFEVNVIGTVNLLDAVREVNSKCKVLIIGSSEEYGKVLSMPITEEHQLDPQSPYAISKVTQEFLSKVYVNAYGLNIVLTRSFNHIGSMQEPTFVIADWAKQIAQIEKGIREPIIRVGNTQVQRDFTDVRDVIRAYIMLIQNGVAGEVYNIGSGVAYKLKEILAILISQSNMQIEVLVDESKYRPNETDVIQCDYSKIYDTCSWKPQYTLETTLKDVLNYWRQRIGK